MRHHNHYHGPRGERLQLRIGGPGFGPMGPGPGFRRGGGGGRGGRRGDVRAAILLLLAQEPMHGYQLIQQIEQRSNGDWKPSPGSVYPTMSALEDEGLIAITQVDGRKTARLTPAGQAHVTAAKATLADPFQTGEEPLGGSLRDVKRQLRLLATAVSQVAAVGSPALIEDAARVLATARADLYRLLAGDGQA